MTDDELKEKQLEADIETSLITNGGYVKGDPHDFNRSTAFNEQTLLQFIKNTQPKMWKRYETTYPSDPEGCFIANLCKAIKNEGLLNLLRHQFKDRGMKFYLCYFKPELSYNKEAVEHYDQNILTCVRQLRYSLSNENSIDIVLFLNGIPVVSMELKNQFTGQDVTNAIRQYKFDRATKDTLFEFKNRVFVHFAVDLYNIYMTTRLLGDSTYFLPFNQGSNGAGNVGGQGNPQNPDGYMTSYLWEKVLIKDRLMEIIQKYLHLQKEKDKKTGKVKETMIFPRFHQLDVVTKLISDVKQNGTGKSYLIQHSAGSGKSNSIAWLAHQLSGLHNNDDDVIFNSIIVLTDRRVLDSQLQDTIYQFDHVAGVVKKVKKNSAELRDAINGGTKIIISTLQKFPNIYKEITSNNKNFAVIIDEAHSSQSGRAATTVIEGLADIDEALKEYAEIEGKEEANRKDDEDIMLQTLAAQGTHHNLSFFAFTATPKSKTLERFGTKQPDGKFKAFHIYSMRQAIEEGFILDVLKHYMTYKTYYRLIKRIKDDPEIDTTKGAKAITRFEALHPHNIAQKTEIMIEHFRDITMNKIGGRAKAMVVTSSRLQAVKYLQEFRKYIAEHKYEGIDVLVAFSGELQEKDSKEVYSETKLNIGKDGEHIKESQLPEYFHDDFNILIVADKYQTGFDEPYLHTMFVDKKLQDVKAVQTLSRLNRTMKGKEDTFVLDFVNDAKDIKESFQQYYQAIELEKEIDPNDLNKLKNVLDEMQVYNQNEIGQFANLYYKSEATANALGKLSQYLKPAIDRFNALDKEKQDQFRKVLGNFIRMYGFVIQVVRLFDKELQQFYVYAKYLSKCIRRAKSEAVDLDDKLLLEYYKKEKTFEGSIQLDNEDSTTKPSSGGTGTTSKKKEPLSVIIEKFNNRFGTKFEGEDKVLLQIKEDLEKDETIVKAGMKKDKTLLEGLYGKSFNEVMVSRYEQNDAFFKEVMQDSEKLDFIKKALFEVLFDDLKTRANKKKESM
ncbi:MAG: type I restriction endonuclease subunit R [Alphaproteobacteria bacterium]|nr:type I restriction endonuclease subunit R [Alphaproteobacteria bacterium]